MEITMFGMYLFTRLSGLSTLCCVAATVSTIILAVVCWFCLIFGAEDEMGPAIKVLKRKFIWFLYFSLVFGSILIPTQKEMAAIYIVPKLINNEQIQELPVNALNLINTQFKAWIKDISPVETDNGSQKSND